MIEVCSQLLILGGAALLVGAIGAARDLHGGPGSLRTRMMVAMARFRRGLPQQEHRRAQTEVIDAAILEPNWIYRGRDAALEQELIRRFKKAM